jgi:glycosidase
MLWTSGLNAGFTTSIEAWPPQPWFPWPPANYTTINVDVQTSDPTSLLSHYRNLISLRNNHPALRSSSVNNFTADNSAIYANLRLSASEQIITVVNVSSSPVTNCTLSLASSPLPKGKYLVSPLMGEGTFENLKVKKDGKIKKDLLISNIPAYGTIILDLQPKKDK